MLSFFSKHKGKVKWLAILLVICCISIVLSNYWIDSSTRSQLYSDVTLIPARKVGLVLGASKNTNRGTHNLYFTYRIQAAYQLFKAHKIQYLLLSGDNHIKGYDEPSDMREALIALGVPDSCIVLDYAGFRTLDSVVRCNEVFGEDSITIVSQEFHNQRALFIANKNNIHAIGFNAQEVNKNYSFKTRVREYFARVKCVLDIYVLYTSPKFLGKKIHIGK
ncbi:MAG: YdcF family protein [Bacteroidetes bacterium]|nr:YdcF family protein [Bacteroidota bacterium]